jgi:predicted DNA-binding transcriptional regulator YafY
MRPADRLFQIVLHLSRGRVVTARFLAEHLGVSDRTVYRDVQDLVRSGVPIEGEAGVGYRLRRGYQVPPLMFDEGELQALTFGVRVAKAYGDSALAESADRVLAKIDAVLPERLRGELDSARLVVPPASLPSATPALLGDVREAINQRLRLFLDYHDAEGAGTERIVWPLSLAYWGQTWTLGAWCELRQAWRSFRVDRIAACRTLSSRFPDEPGKRLDDYMAAVHQGLC